MSDKKITFIPSGRGKAQCPPDPNYPHGIAIPPTSEARSCFVELPYPAPECGMYLVECATCKGTLLITAAGRPDDPISCHMPCQDLTQ